MSKKLTVLAIIGLFLMVSTVGCGDKGGKTKISPRARRMSKTFHDSEKVRPRDDNSNQNSKNNTNKETLPGGDDDDSVTITPEEKKCYAAMEALGSGVTRIAFKVIEGGKKADEVNPVHEYKDAPQIRLIDKVLSIEDKNDDKDLAFKLDLKTSQSDKCVLEEEIRRRIDGKKETYTFNLPVNVGTESVSMSGTHTADDTTVDIVLEITRK